VVALVFIALGRREAAIVGAAVILTLAVTLFASWAWGFTLNRVSLFALIFSIGILVDDAIVVVENIHRHQPAAGKPLPRSSPARWTRWAGRPSWPPHGDRRAAADGLRQRPDGAVHEPDPINASMGMLLSLAIAFIVTPWLARLWMKAWRRPAAQAPPAGGGLAPLFERIFARCSTTPRAAQPPLLGLAWRADRAVGGAAGGRLVVLKMLPFDNKSSSRWWSTCPPARR
jgi:multidrug efflux pump subunit AcrB